MQLVTIQPFFNRALDPQTTPLDANGLPAADYLFDPFYPLKNTLPAIYDGMNAYYPLTNLGYDENSWNKWILNRGYDPQEIQVLKERFLAYQKEHPYDSLIAPSPAAESPSEEKEEKATSKVAAKQSLPPYFSKYHAKLLSPIPQPLQDILCIGMNYCASIKERQQLTNPPKHMLYFGKRSYRLAGHGQVLPNLENTTNLSLFEAELAVILGKPLYRARNLDEANEAIFAYSLFNDFTAPKVCEQFGQAYIGKSLPGFAVLGPWLIPAAEIQTNQPEKDKASIEIHGYKNGILVQKGFTDQMIRSVAEILLEVSQYIILAPGTILATGTPPDLLETNDDNLSPPFKKIGPGDRIDCYSPSIGHLCNQIDEY